MAQTTINLSMHVAWWAKPIAYAVAYVMQPFAGVERAANAATCVFMRGIRITVAAGKPASAR
jgi:hypothetical protein